jgi:thiamine-phosphate pyrophosphorylase
VTPRLIVVTDFTRPGSERHLQRIEALLTRAQPGTVLVQLRDHALSARRRFELGGELRTLTRRSEQWFVVNDRLDLFRVLDADGVHLGEASVASAEARAFGARFVSRSVHRLEALPIDADAVLFAPIVEARHGRAAHGIEVLGHARERLAGRLLYALGGVSASNATACLGAGADGVAVVGAALDHDDPLPLLGALDIGR